jgi:hypothetical protein
MYEKNRGLRRTIASVLGYANVRTPTGLYLGRQMTVRVDEARCERVVAKIVRGLYFHEHDERLPPNIPVVGWMLQRPQQMRALDEIATVLKPGSKDWPQVFEYWFNRTTEDHRASMWVMKFFGKIFFCAFSGDHNYVN